NMKHLYLIVLAICPWYVGFAKPIDHSGNTKSDSIDYPYNAYYLAKQLVEQDRKLSSAGLIFDPSLKKRSDELLPYLLGYLGVDTYNYNTIVYKLDTTSLRTIFHRMVNHADYAKYLFNIQDNTLRSEEKDTEIHLIF